jgi:hypothetical protein
MNVRVPLEPSTANILSGGWPLVGSNAKNTDAKRLIYNTVHKYDDVRLSIALHAAYLVDAISAVDARVWRKAVSSLPFRPHGYLCSCTWNLKSFEMACLRMAYKFDDGEMYQTKLYREHMSNCRIAVLNDVEKKLLAHEDSVPFVIQCPHTIIDEYTNQLARTYTRGCRQRAHAIVELVVCESSVLFEYLSGSIALAAMYHVLHDPEIAHIINDSRSALEYAIAFFCRRIAPNGYEHNYTTEQAADCVLLMRETRFIGSMVTPPPLKRVRVPLMLAPRCLDTEREHGRRSDPKTAHAPTRALAHDDVSADAGRFEDSD